jgi:hypothetical protein
MRVQGLTRGGYLEHVRGYAGEPQASSSPSLLKKNRSIKNASDGFLSTEGSPSGTVNVLDALKRPRLTCGSTPANQKQFCRTAPHWPIT